MPSTVALIAALAPIVVGILGLIGTRWMAGIQQKAKENEGRLKSYEAYDHTYSNLLADYDRMTLERNGVRTEADQLRLSLAAALATIAEKDRQIRLRDAQIERWIESKETDA